MSYFPSTIICRSEEVDEPSGGGDAGGRWGTLEDGIGVERRYQACAKRSATEADWANCTDNGRLCMFSVGLHLFIVHKYIYLFTYLFI